MLGKTKTPVVPQVPCCVVARGTGAVRAASHHGTRRFGCTAPSGPWLTVDTRRRLRKLFFSVLAHLRHSEAWQWPVWNLARTALACSILLCRNMEKPRSKQPEWFYFVQRIGYCKSPCHKGSFKLAGIQSLSLKKQTSIPSGPATVTTVKSFDHHKFMHSMHAATFLGL